LAELNWSLESFTASDGYRWHYRRYGPSGSARSRVVFVHGIQSHAGWYEHSCDRLRTAGHEVFFLDRRGSGQNQQDRGDAPGFRRLLNDIAEFLRSLPRPIVLGGISWGGKLVTALQRRHPGLCDGLMLLCPGFFAQVRPSKRQRLGILWSRLVAPRRLFPIPLNEPELFTATPQWQKFIANDPVSLREATARFFVESVRLDGYLHVVPDHVKLPILLLLAGGDRIIANEPTRRFVARFAATDRQIIEYPNAQHTLEFEADPEPFIADMSTWLNRRFA
jgi:alpha-beta hydrolase superfamily lysophospholipase